MEMLSAGVGVFFEINCKITIIKYNRVGTVRHEVSRAQGGRDKFAIEEVRRCMGSAKFIE